MTITNTNFYTTEDNLSALATANQNNNIQITCDGVSYDGFMFGTDEMYDGDDFYQLFVSSDRKIYVMYFEITDEDGNEIPLDCIDYDAPYKVEECDYLAVSDEPRMVSLNNGRTFLDAEEAIEAMMQDGEAWFAANWNALVQFMDEDAREQVHAELAPCGELEFLKRYLEIAPEDLILG